MHRCSWLKKKYFSPSAENTDKSVKNYTAFMPPGSGIILISISVRPTLDESVKWFYGALNSITY